MSARSVVEKFGGQAPLARMLGKGPSTVAYWVKHDNIPSKWHRELLALARKENILLTTAELVGQEAEIVTPEVLPAAHLPGVLQVGDESLDCYVLNDGSRVISRTAVMRFLVKTSGGDLESYVGVQSLVPYVPSGWRDELVEFTIPEVTHKRVMGLRAETFLEICRAYMAARDAGALTERQEEIAKRASAFVLACSTVGLIALIDEATGYQYERAEDALRFKLKLFLNDEMRKWEKTFPDELWKEFGRLTGWTGPISSRPKYWGHLVNELVYELLDPDVAEWLKVNAPKPRHGQNYHQWLTDQYGLRKLNEHIWLLIGIASTCHSMTELKQQVGFRFGKVPLQLTIFTDPPRSN